MSRFILIVIDSRQLHSECFKKYNTNETNEDNFHKIIFKKISTKNPYFQITSSFAVDECFHSKLSNECHNKNPKVMYNFRRLSTGWLNHNLFLALQKWFF